MTAARAAIGNFCFKKSIHYILSKCGWFDISDLIKYSSLNIIHKIQTLKKPPSLVSYFRISKNKLGARTLGARSGGSKNVTYREQTT